MRYRCCRGYGVADKSRSVLIDRSASAVPFADIGKERMKI